MQIVQSGLPGDVLRLHQQVGGRPQSESRGDQTSPAGRRDENVALITMEVCVFLNYLLYFQSSGDEQHF